ncbi:MAG: zinc dependent phospholipase C family protein [Candidatus Fibromonas sp.]|jgi:hypothetical protein|nr:zinc dependent phospholipase C family protein [Candidatus Fibromonas sp.]
MDSRKLPLWKMALQAAPGSFGAMPANFTPGLPLAAKSAATENKTVKNEEKRDKFTLNYVAIKTQFCTDSSLAFSGSLATAYFRAMENKDEKIFLQGNAFLAKLARAVFEKDETLFAETCEASKDENYFLECAKALEEQGFVFEKGEKFGKDSWLSLFKIVLLLTEEYLATKCDLPSLKAVECEDNSENTSDLKIIFATEGTEEEQLKEAAMQPLKLVLCSSDFLSIGDNFFYFIKENFPYKDNENELETFLKKIFDENVCKNLNPLPAPDSFATAVMEAGKLGAYKDKKIYINHRLALASLRDPASSFILLLTLLHEYGHFLDDILHKRADIKGDSEGEEGKSFAGRFMEYSAGDLFNKDFKFADFTALGQKDEEQKFEVGISDLSYEERKEIWCIFEFSEDLGSGSLKRPDDEVIDDVEFFGLTSLPSNATNVYNSANRTHQNLTENGAKSEKIKYNGFLTDGSIWPDFPTVVPLETSIFYTTIVLAGLKEDNSEGHLIHESHYGKNQHWHSMCPKLTQTPTNKEVKNRILEQAEKWYSEAIKKKKENKTDESLFEIGKLCHMVQDSFVLSHSWRRYIGDERFMKANKIETRDNGKIWTFQDYAFQDGNFHALADCPTQRFEVETIGYKSAENASKQILFRYSQNFEWNSGKSGISSPKDYLQKIYEIHPGREDLPSGGSHPWFKKDNPFSREQVQGFLTSFSMEIEEC